MARKDHLVTIQEEDKTSKKSFKRNNAILFQAIQPTIANEINGIGATSKTPDEVKDTKFPILNPIDPIGKNTDGTVNVDLSLENSPFTCIELSDVGNTIFAITINLINLVKNFAERFILDITKDPGNVSTPTVTFVPTVENLPAGFPDNDPRYLLEIIARETPTETRFEVVNRSGGSGTIPAGTIENQHLEWDNTATDWVAVVNSTYGATGPFATTGFLNFANDQIMLSQRNAADSGNVEIKVATNDFLDITENNNAPVTLRLRAQNAIDPDQSLTLTQLSGTGGAATFASPTQINLDIGATTVASILVTELSMNDLNVTNITEIQGRDDATPFKIVFDQAEDADTFISDDTATADRINVTAGGVTFWSWLNDGTDKIAGITTGSDGILTISDGQLNMAARIVPPDADVANDEMTIYGDTATDPLRMLFKRKTVAGVVSTATFVYSPMDFLLDMGNNEINNTAGIFPQDNGLDDIGGLSNSYNSVFMDALHFVHSQVQVAGERMISFEGSGNMEINVPTGDSIILRVNAVDEYLFNPTSFQLKNLNQLHFLDAGDNQDIKMSYIDPVFLIDLSGSSTQFKINNAATIPDFVLEGENTGATFLAHNLRFDGKSSTGVNREYGDIKVRQIVSTNTSEDAGMEFELIEAGTPNVTYLQLNAQLLQVRILKELNLNNNEITGVDFMNFNERVGDPTVGANEGVLYVKDVATNSHLFFDNNTEAPVDLTLGGGISFPITPTVDVRGTVTVNQAVDISQADGHVTTMTLGAASITVTFSGFPASGTQQTWELHVSQDATGGRTLVISPTPVESFTIAQGANKLTILTFLTNDGGTDIHVVPTLRGTISLSANQTPWLQNIDADGFSLQDLNDLEFRDDVTKPADTVTYLSKGTTDFFYNIPTGDLHNFTVDGTSEMTINATTIDFQGNSVIDGILGVTITGISGITGLGTQGQNLVMGNFNITGISDLIFTEAGTQIQATVGGILIQVPDTTDKIDMDVNGRIVSIRDGFVDISTNSLDVTERTAPAATANQAKLYSKDVSTVTHMFVIDSAGVETDLTTGAGANQQLSNLVATVAVNLSLVGATDGVQNLGTTGLRWGIAFVDSIDIQDDLASNPPESGVTEIEADQGGMNLGIAASGDVFDFYQAGTSMFQIKDDGELQWTTSGRQHKIVAQSTSFDIVSELQSDEVELWSGAGRTNASLFVGDTESVFATESDVTGRYKVIIQQRNFTPADARVIGDLIFQAENTSSALEEYAVIEGNSSVVTAGSEQGQLRLGVQVNSVPGLVGLELIGVSTALRIGFFGVTPVVRQTLASNPTTTQISTALRNLGLTVL